MKYRPLKKRISYLQVGNGKHIGRIITNFELFCFRRNSTWRRSCVGRSWNVCSVLPMKLQCLRNREDHPYRTSMTSLSQLTGVATSVCGQYTGLRRRVSLGRTGSGRTSRLAYRSSTPTTRTCWPISRRRSRTRVLGRLYHPKRSA